MAVKTPGFWKKRRVLITGGSGFLGYWLSCALAGRGARVTVLDIRPFPSFKRKNGGLPEGIAFVRGSILSEKKLKSILAKGRFQTVFHLAAEAIESRAYANPEHALETNAAGTWRLLEALKKNGSASEIIVASSDKAYGEHAKLPYREHYALNGKSPYACSKSCTDLIAQMYAFAYKLPVAVVRCGNIYGGGDLNGTRLIPDALESMHSGKTFRVRSNGKFLRDYIYVDDIVSAYITVAEKFHKKDLGGQTFNVGNNTPLSVMQVLNIMKRAARRPLRATVLNGAKHEIRNQYLDSTYAKKILGWTARISHTEGMKRTIKWYDEFFKRGGKLDR